MRLSADRVRRPVLVVGAVALAAGQWGRISSGRPFDIVTGVGVALFWVSTLLLVGPLGAEDRTRAAAWRREARRSASLWTYRSAERFATMYRQAGRQRLS